jgi:hypothetical protein
MPRYGRVRNSDLELALIVVNEKVFRGMQCSTPRESGRDRKAAFVSRVLRGAAFVLPNETQPFDAHSE